jgi:hypothetical protein
MEFSQVQSQTIFLERVKHTCCDIQNALLIQFLLGYCGISSVALNPTCVWLIVTSLYLLLIKCPGFLVLFVCRLLSHQINRSKKWWRRHLGSPSCSVRKTGQFLLFLIPTIRISLNRHIHLIVSLAPGRRISFQVGSKPNQPFIFSRHVLSLSLVITCLIWIFNL